MANSLKYVKELSEAHGVSGYEDDVRLLIKGYLDEWGVPSRTDALGNLIAELPSDSDEYPVVILDAHMDEIGLVINYIEPTGYLRFTTIGGWDERVLPAQRVRIKTLSGKFIDGIIGTPPPHILSAEDRKKPFALSSLFIDVGARNSDEVSEMGIMVGNSAVIGGEFGELTPGVFSGKALDNRVGCAMLLNVIERYVKSEVRPPVKFVAVFSTFEEIGGRGAKVATFSVVPQIALVLESTVAGDTPGNGGATCPTHHGRGPAFTLIDKSVHVPQWFVSYLASLAQEAGIPHQLKTPIYGGTNAGAMQTVGSGVVTGVVSVPCRYIHGPWAIVRKEDFINTLRLVEEFVDKVSGLFEQSDRF